jgi:anti-sigma factor RsiW
LTCDEARERLPWLGNGSLSPEEAAAVEAHLAACHACREEREATRLAARLFATHPSPADLVAYTFGDLAGAEREAIAGHLATCAACAGEQALSAESRRREPSVTARPERRAEWRRLLLAAAVGAALLASAGWFWSWQRWQQDGDRWARRQERLLERLSRLEQRAPPSAPALTSPAPTPAGVQETAQVEGHHHVRAAQVHRYRNARDQVRRR